MSIDPAKKKKVEKLLKKNKAQTDPMGAIWDEVLLISEKLDEINEKLEDMIQ